MLADVTHWFKKKCWLFKLKDTIDGWTEAEKQDFGALLCVASCVACYVYPFFLVIRDLFTDSYLDDERKSLETVTYLNRVHERTGLLRCTLKLCSLAHLLFFHNYFGREDPTKSIVTRRMRRFLTDHLSSELVPVHCEKIKQKRQKEKKSKINK